MSKTLSDNCCKMGQDIVVTAKRRRLDAVLGWGPDTMAATGMQYMLCCLAWMPQDVHTSSCSSIILGHERLPSETFFSTQTHRPKQPEQCAIVYYSRRVQPARKSRMRSRIKRRCVLQP